MEEKHRMVAILVLVALFGYLSYLLVVPFAGYILLGVILAFLVHPVYLLVQKKTSATTAACIVIIAVLLLIILPSIYLTSSLVTQTSNAYQQAIQNGISFDDGRFAQYIQSFTGVAIEDSITDLLGAGKKLIADSLPSIISTTSAVIIGIVIFFFVLFYCLKDGHIWYERATNLLPIKTSHKRQLRDEIERMTKALFYGQIITAFIVGGINGALFWLFGIPNPVFWGFVMMICSFLPFLGAPLVYVPAGILLLMSGQWFSGISILVLCSAALFFIDNVFKPRFISSSASIHPLTVIIGAFGGIYLLGFIGFMIGPLILNIFFTLLQFYFGMQE